MYNQQQHQGGLMFNPYQPTSQMVQWPLNSPPALPGNVQVPMQLNAYYPMICAALANEITASASQSPARMFTFNQVSSNNWMNQPFIDLVCMAVDMATKNLGKQPHAPLDNHVSEGIREALALFVSMNIAEHQGLQAIMDPTVVQNAFGNVNQMLALKNEISHYKNVLNGQSNMQMQQPMSMHHGGYPNHVNNGYPQNNGFAVNPAFAARAGMTHHQPIPTNNFNVPNGASIFTNDPNSSYTNSHNGNATNSRYAYANKVTPVQPQAPAPVTKYASYPQSAPAQPQVQQNKLQPIAEFEIVTRDDWKWSLEQPVQDKLYDELLFRLEWRRYHNNGNPVVRSVLIPLTGEEMNKADHEINTAATPSQWNTALSKGFDNPAAQQRAFKADTKVVSSVLDLKNHSSAYEALRATEAQDGGEEIVSEVSDITMVDVSVNSPLIDVVLSAQDEPANKINRVFIEVAKPIVAKIEDQNTIEQPNFTGVIYDMQFMNFNQVSDKLREWTNLGINEAGVVAEKLDAILTDKTNSVLRNNLALTVSIESYMEDIKDLPGYLSNKYGEAIAKKFSLCSDLIIKTTMNVLDESQTNLRPDIDDEKPQTQFVSFFLATTHSANFVNCTSTELGLSKLKKVQLVEDKKLNDICKNIINCTTKINSRTAVWLLTTCDYSTYKIHKGLLAGNADSFFIEPYKT